MGRSFVQPLTFGALAVAAAIVLGAPAWAQGAGGFEAAPGSAPIVTSNGMPVVNMATPTPISGAAAQSDYGAFGDAAPPGMYVAPLGYGAGAGAAAAQPVYSAQSAPANMPGSYSIQQQPTSGPYAQPQPYYGPQANPYSAYVNPYAPPPPPNAYGAPMADYTPQPYVPPYAAPYAPPQQAQPYMPEPQAYAAQQQAGQQASPYTAAQRMVQGLPPAPMPAPQPMQPAPAAGAVPMQNPNMAMPYASGTTAYGAPLPRGIGMPQQAGVAVEGGYTLGPGDRVRVTVFGEQDLSGEYQLDGNGNIRLPLVGMTRAVGYTAGGLEAVIRAALVPNFLRDPRINVEITGYRPIYVVGAVQKPGQYSYVNDMTLLNAVGLAGGFTTQAKESVVYVRHEGATEERAVPTNVPLLIRPGDTVRVETTVFWDMVNFFGPLSSPVAIAAAAR